MKVAPPKQDIAISVKRLGKAFKSYNSGTDLLKEIVTRRPSHKEKWVLQDISFDIPRGEVVGVIGSNGAGKSTLLKIITGLLDATTGSVSINGRVSAILELGTGFHPDFTGRENIVTGGMCLGMTREEVDAKLPWIIEFSELESVIDQPFKTYSSGMQARLTFSTAISIDPEIFIVDEALAAGDAYFVSKCMKRIREICNSGATVLFVSHSTGQVAMLCDTALWIENGALRELGPARDVTRRYDYAVHERISHNAGQVVEVTDEGAAGAPPPALEPAPVPEASGQQARSEEPAQNQTVPSPPPNFVPIFRRGPVIIDSVQFLTENGKPERIFRTWDPFAIHVDYRCDDTTIKTDLGIGVGIERERDLLMVAQFGTPNPSGWLAQDQETASHCSPPLAKGRIILDLGELQLLEGDYLISLGLLPNIPGHIEFYEYRHRFYRIKVIPAGYASGAVLYPKIKFRHFSLHG